MIRDILSLRKGECKFCLTDDTPFFFCGDPQIENSVYCDEHHARCYNGFGQDINRTEAMIYGTDHSVVRVRPSRGGEKRKFLPQWESPIATPVDIQIGDDK